jgi:hypothetical protein
MSALELRKAGSECQKVSRDLAGKAKKQDWEEKFKRFAKFV